MQLLLSTPWWLIILCFLLGAIYAGLLYRSSLNKKSHQLMAVFRFLAISLISFFLLSPILIHRKSRIEKPKVLMILDHSESVISSPKANFYKTEFLNQWKNLKSELGSDYEVEFLNLGGTINYSDTVTFNEQRTNLSQVYDFVNNTYNKQNVGAIILASDGVFNRGSHPIYRQFKSSQNLYTIGLGDTSTKKDALVKELIANEIAYINNSFPIEVAVAASQCSGKKAILTVSSDGKTIYTEQIQLTDNNFFKNYTFSIDADKAGIKHIIVNLSAVEGELTLKNNRKDVFVDVIDGREKIALIFNGPHPDIGAIKESILSNQNYEVVLIPFSQIKLNELKNYNVAVLYQIPSRKNSSNALISQLKTNKTPIWSIVGAETNVEQLPLISSFGRIDRNQGRFNESQAILNSNFNLFTLESATAEIINNFAPLKTPYGFYSIQDNSQVLAFQKIGSVNTKSPIWGFYNSNGEKASILYGEGFWRWRLSDFAENENFNATNELVSKTIQFLSIKDDKRKFKAYPVLKVFDEDESVKFFAELYNANYELINDKDVSLNLVNSDKKAFQYTFGKFNKSYALDLGLLPAGVYQYKAKAEGVKEEISGKIIINPLQLEMLNTQADFGLLRDWAQQNNGQFFYDNQLSELKNEVLKNKNIGNISKMEKSIDELINLKWLFYLILLIICLEWFYRKFEGAY